MSSAQKIYNIGTTVYYAGDDAVTSGYGTITDCSSDYLGELQMEITLQDRRVINNVTPAEFETRSVLGNTDAAEFHIVDTWEDELVTLSDMDSDEDVGYSEENSVWSFS